MGRCYIKPERDVDFYVEWSSVVDSVVGYGNRAEMLADAKEEWGRRGVEEHTRALALADETGTSARKTSRDYPAFGAWDDVELRIMEGGGPGYLLRADLRRYCDLLEADDEAGAYALVRADTPAGVAVQED